MLSTSLRRATWAPLSGIPRSAQNVPSTGLLGATRHVHQRRYSSSSKPPVPPSDGSRRLDTSTPEKGVNSSGEKGKTTRRRGKDNGARNGSSKASQQHAAFSKLPSVPSTQHRQPHDVHVASFFSIHRPISVTTTVPPTSSTEAFDAIFSSKKFLRNEPDDVIFTLSSTAQNMESMANGMSESDDQFGQLQRSFTSDPNGDLQILDGPEAKMSVEEFVRRLRPFHPPPPPIPMDMNPSPDTIESQAQNQHETSTYSTVLTIRETRNSDGRKTYEASTGPFVRDMENPEHEGITIDAPSGSVSGMTYAERRRHNQTVHAISTKRRRKVKMKKHKFKKLMRRTRTLRRKLDKA